MHQAPGDAGVSLSGIKTAAGRCDVLAACAVLRWPDLRHAA